MPVTIQHHSKMPDFHWGLYTDENGNVEMDTDTARYSRASNAQLKRLIQSPKAGVKNAARTELIKRETAEMVG